jgi:hypothetical protein
VHVLEVAITGSAAKMKTRERMMSRTLFSLQEVFLQIHPDLSGTLLLAAESTLLGGEGQK